MESNCQPEIGAMSAIADGDVLAKLLINSPPDDCLSLMKILLNSIPRVALRLHGNIHVRVIIL
ncbi:MAG: hypothetical protein LBK82_15770 [Planctomycetaceae bacterium]|nr:hypothetical protein [Planctomycetaceae bacterium]